MDGLFERVCHRIDGIIGEDVGKRGISAIKLPDQLQEAAANFLDSRAVVVLTGFPCRLKDSPPTESDGPPGAIALAAAALRLGKPTAIATDECNTAVMAACAKAAGLEGLGAFELLSFPAKPRWTQAETDHLAAVAARYDHAVAIERAGRAADDGYYTMRAFSMVELVAPLDELLTIDCACGVADTAGVAATPVESDGEDDDDEEEEEEAALARRRRTLVGVAPPFAVGDGATGVEDGCPSDDATGALPSLSEEGDTSFDDVVGDGSAAGAGSGSGSAPSTGRQGFPRASYAPPAGHVKNVVQRIEGRLQSTPTTGAAAPVAAAVPAPVVAVASPGGRPLLGRTEASRGPAAVATSGAPAPLTTSGASGHLASATDGPAEAAAAAVGPASPAAGSATSVSTAVSSLAWAEIAGPTDLDVTSASSSSGSEASDDATGAAAAAAAGASGAVAAPTAASAATVASPSGAGSSSARGAGGAAGGSSGSPAGGGVVRSTLSSSLSRGSIVPAPLINLRARGARGTLATGASASSGTGGGGAPARHHSFMMPYRADVWSRAGSVAAPQSVMLRTSTGIGDGGNECGMGKVLDAVREHIPNGPTIACVVPADALITAGVSNWGGWGLVAAVEALVRCRLAEAAAAGTGGASASGAADAAPVTSSTTDAAGAAATVTAVAGSACSSLPPAAVSALFAGAPGCLLTSEEGERAIAEAMIASGGRDGITGALDGSVDGMPLTTHLGVLAQLRRVLADAFP